jgi:hypothetical protein
MSTRNAGKSRQMPGFIDKKHIAIIIKIFAGEILCVKFELDYVVAQDRCIDATLAEID